MQRQVAAVNTSEPSAQEPSATRTDGSPARERSPSKFIYPGGSRPLEGYTIKRGVGHGGFGEIYYAVSDAGKEVALKLIRRNLDIELRGIRQCLNLKHPNLLALYDIRRDDRDDTWVVMEYVAGECLEDAVGGSPQGMTAEQTLAWFHGIAAGVAYLHDRGLVHRDLKPANIFSDEGIVKVGDYGLSKFISCSRRSGQTESVGTVHYMAPEVANGRYGKEIDIYALGVMLYEMLTGHVPFEGESVGEVLMKHLTAEPDLSMLAEPYRGVVARALEKDPAKRFSSVKEMMAALPQPHRAPPGTGRLPLDGAENSGPSARNGAKPQAAERRPVLAVARETWTSMHAAWSEANLHPALKVVLPLAGALLLILGALFMLVLLAGIGGVLLPLVLALLMAYGAYRLVRLVVTWGHSPERVARHRVLPPRPDRPSSPATTDGPATPPRHAPGFARAAKRHDKRPKYVPKLPERTPREGFTELIGSMLVTVPVVAAACVVMVLLNVFFGDAFRPAPTPGQCAWLALMGIAGTWAVLIPSKFWEGTGGETTLRRFIMMVVGLGLGAAAYGTAAMLMTDLPVDPSLPSRFPSLGRQWPSGFYATDGRPMVMAYMACFGTLFLLLRWWLQASPWRPVRLSLWSLLVSVVAAWLVAGLWSFPQPWLIMAAGTISISVQMASPWIHPSRRYRQTA